MLHRTLPLSALGSGIGTRKKQKEDKASANTPSSLGSREPPSHHGGSGSAVQILLHQIFCVVEKLFPAKWNFHSHDSSQPGAQPTEDQRQRRHDRNQRRHCHNFHVHGCSLTGLGQSVLHRRCSCTSRHTTPGHRPLPARSFRGTLSQPSKARRSDISFSWLPSAPPRMNYMLLSIHRCQLRATKPCLFWPDLRVLVSKKLAAMA
jgi:hypothetical protein